MTDTITITNEVRLELKRALEQASDLPATYNLVLAETKRELQDAGGIDKFGSLFSNIVFLCTELVRIEKDIDKITHLLTDEK